MTEDSRKCKDMVSFLENEINSLLDKQIAYKLVKEDDFEWLCEGMASISRARKFISFFDAHLLLKKKYQIERPRQFCFSSNESETSDPHPDLGLSSRVL